MKERILKIVKNELFMKIFFIPCGIQFLMSLISLIFLISDETTSFLQAFVDILLFNLSFIIPWFIISFVFSLIIIKRRENHPEKLRIKNKKINDNSAKLIVKCFRRAKFPFIMSIICFLIGTLFYLGSLYFNLKVKLVIASYGFAPCLLYMIIMFLISKFYKKSGIKFFLDFVTVLITFFLPIYYFMVAFGCLDIKMDNPITDTKNYGKIVKSETLLNAFPEKIPNDVENIEFYYSPGVYSGEAKYSLYYIDKSVTIEEFDNKYKNKALWIGNKDDYPEKYDLLREIFSYAPIKRKEENNFVIYLIDRVCDDSRSHIRCTFLLAAYNDKTNEVIYFARQ